jgi:hypothetical protein
LSIPDLLILVGLLPPNPIVNPPGLITKDQFIEISNASQGCLGILKGLDKFYSRYRINDKRSLFL